MSGGSKRKLKRLINREKAIYLEKLKRKISRQEREEDTEILITEQNM